MLLVDSVFVNNGGGKVLLAYLVHELESRGINAYFLFDGRCDGEFLFIPSSRKLFVDGFTARFQFYKRSKHSFTKVFCFGNVPPPIRLTIPVYTYFHNVSLLRQPSTYRLKEMLLKRFKSFVISQLKNNTTSFIVQTENVRELLVKHFSIPPEACLIIPFFKVNSQSASSIRRKNSFVYVSNGNSHKNHFNLLNAWNWLAQNGIFPELHLTVTENYQHTCEMINDAITKGANIVNHGFIDPRDLYAKCEYLIYPSMCESFGLGLIEAVHYGCRVIASELPYVYEVVSPSATFDPCRPSAIAELVGRLCAGELIKPSKLIVKNEVENLLSLLSTNPISK